MGVTLESWIESLGHNILDVGTWARSFESHVESLGHIVLDIGTWVSHLSHC